jgi:hypothetical protein
MVYELAVLQHTVVSKLVCFGQQSGTWYVNKYLPHNMANQLIVYYGQHHIMHPVSGRRAYWTCKHFMTRGHLVPTWENMFMVMCSRTGWHTSLLTPAITDNAPFVVFARPPFPKSITFIIIVHEYYIPIGSLELLVRCQKHTTFTFNCNVYVRYPFWAPNGSVTPAPPPPPPLLSPIIGHMHGKSLASA